MLTSVLAANHFPSSSKKEKKKSYKVNALKQCIFLEDIFLEEKGKVEKEKKEVK